jgi:hypothetical protein
MMQDPARFKLRMGAKGSVFTGVAPSLEDTMSLRSVNFVESLSDVAANERPIVTPL